MDIHLIIPSFGKNYNKKLSATFARKNLK